MALCVIVPIHVGDEAVNGFLNLWNPAVSAMGLGWLRMGFPLWIGLLALGVIGLLILSIWVRRGTWWTIPAAYVFALLMGSNAVEHLAYSLHRREWMAGSYTSPLLLAGSVALWICAPRQRL
jgi:hypothetical protein